MGKLFTKQLGSYLGITPNVLKLVVCEDVWVIVDVMKRHFKSWYNTSSTPAISNVYTKKCSNVELLSRRGVGTFNRSRPEEATNNEKKMHCHSKNPLVDKITRQKRPILDQNNPRKLADSQNLL